MSTSKEFMESLLLGLGKYEVSCRAMMGEYVVYCKGKVIGGVYDERVLVKPTESALRLLPDAEYQLPYEGAKPALFVQNLEDKEFIGRLFTEIANELPLPRKKKSK